MTDSFFPRNSPWGQAAQSLQPSQTGPGVPVPEPGANQRDLEEAHHMLKNIINTIDTEHAIPVSGVRVILEDLNEIENLLYRNLR